MAINMTHRRNIRLNNTHRAFQSDSDHAGTLAETGKLKVQHRGYEFPTKKRTKCMYLFLLYKHRTRRSSPGWQRWFRRFALSSRILYPPTRLLPARLHREKQRNKITKTALLHINKPHLNLFPLCEKRMPFLHSRGANPSPQHFGWAPLCLCLPTTPPPRADGRP